MELIGFSFFVISGWGLDVDYCNGKWLSLERSQDRSVIFEVAPKYCILDCSADYKFTPFFLRDVCPQE